MRDPLLVLNAGSSSLKFSVYETAEDRSPTTVVHGEVEGIGTAPRLHVFDAAGNVLANRAVAGRGHDGAIAAIHDWFASHAGEQARFTGVGHRVVHGGRDLVEPVLIDAAVLEKIDALSPLAPLHQPHHVAAIRAIASVAPELPQVACFDTAFHHTQSPLAQEFALPQALTAKGIIRYGFHGLSYEYVLSAFAALDPAGAQGRLVIAHLGNGASMCALAGGKSIATTMGFTAVDGLPMGTRTGALDPGVILYLLQQERMSADEIERLIYERSGLLGVSGISSDMRELLASQAPAARHAVDLFVYRAARELGSLAAAIGGIDTLIFTAGIGEHSPAIREQICESARWLGVTLDSTANQRNAAVISAPDSAVSVRVIPTDENLRIALHTRQLLDARQGRPLR